METREYLGNGPYFDRFRPEASQGRSKPLWYMRGLEDGSQEASNCLIFFAFSHALQSTYICFIYKVSGNKPSCLRITRRRSCVSWPRKLTDKGMSSRVKVAPSSSLGYLLRLLASPALCIVASQDLHLRF